LSHSLKETISTSQGIALYVGAVLGSGILILPGMTGGIAGPNALIAWIVMVLLSIPLAYTFAFLSIDYPSSGGVATFARKAFGYYAGALVGWFFFIAGSVGQIIVSLTGGTYIAFSFGLPHPVAYLVAYYIRNFKLFWTKNKWEISASNCCAYSFHLVSSYPSCFTFC
jgi:amino acid efflux transporter